jgi:D-glycero-alpha-D-manno-heptose-7-phosphate kinase
MIISRTPFRMSFVGGGSDLPAYFERRGGAVFSIAIDKYMYVSVHENFDGMNRISYSKLEEKNSVCQLEHPIVRNALIREGLEGLEITSNADIPSQGSGLGSSSSYTVGLLHCLKRYKGTKVDAHDIALEACDIEIKDCNEPIGYQDQFAAAFGGANVFRFNSGNSVKVEPVLVDRTVESKFLASVVFVYTGLTRSANTVLHQQNLDSKSDKLDRQLEQMVSLVDPFRDAFINADLKLLGEILHENWMLKQQLASNVSNSFIDEIYAKALTAGSYGGKLLGAGSGGFMVFICPVHHRDAVKKALEPLRTIDFAIDKMGSVIIFDGENHND